MKIGEKISNFSAEATNGAFALEQYSRKIPGHVDEVLAKVKELSA